MGSPERRECTFLRVPSRQEPVISPRIVHVSQPTTAGVARCVLDLAAGQVEAGWEVTVIAPDDGPLLERATAVGAEVRRWQATRDPGPTVPRETAALRRLLAELRPDVVHLHSSKAGLAGRLALRGRTPTVFQPHAWSFLALEGPVAAAARTWERLAARWTDVTVCVSQDEADAGRRIGIRGAFEVIPNGVDLSRFSPGDRAAARDRLGLGDAPTVVCVGRLCRQKGQDVLVRAWDGVRAEVPDAELVLVGDGPDRAVITELAGAGVTVAGHREDVADWLSAADAVALPSRWEGQALTLLEAMAVARPVVASDVDGVREPLLAGTLPEGGAVVPREDERALADAIVARLLDPERSVEEGRSARRRVEDAHDLDDTVRRSSELAAQLAQRP